MNKTIWVVVVVVLIAGGGWFYLSRPANIAPEADNAPQTGTQTNTEMPIIDSVNIPVRGAEVIKEFTIIGSPFLFSPSSMTVKKGDTVRITFKNSGGTHDFKIDEFNVATKKINDGAEETVEFIADKTGSFEYYCSVGNHRAMGMKGTLTVE
ncbi:MAG: hypothetical protein A2648_01320 [Candidatus Lloydbacteria bacterium RIFCSPHIGHO2_01_FULL_41_20]|uniref:EfeO-type cupredoxin-like domain-containing protein n=1 Tax=Candidatus Lloydbacteria bacterium RIFCSPHIGHO2_01_FULL_41_20 TaxID=1798657 RepID=A0A1G2CS36_9BACT|nr:MAG: hypothetical protein A2648_01320 [Candidatus Lloydbacteria bacterium RIFCSPHIGHO2_01_FULL_41_20]